MQVRFLQQFVKLESAGGIFLFISTMLAIFLANSAFSHFYQIFTTHSLFLINDGLMSIFFLLVGLELKRELASSTHSYRATILLPAFSALGGMLIPALIYILITFDSNEAILGWSIPTATDIAFALGVLSLFNKKVSIELKLFLMSLAIFDDVGAILIITIFYTQAIVWFYLFLTVCLVGVLYLCNRLRTQSLSLYLGVGLLLWFALFKSGVHPTMSGVILALFIPFHNDEEESPLTILESRLHAWVTFGIIPIFALANAGLVISLDNLLGLVTSKVALGSFIGLVVGKQLGIFGFASVLVWLKFASLPKNVSWSALYGVSLLAGIGFTMSLFLGTLSFAGYSVSYLTEVRVGVFLGSLLSGCMGAFVLRRTFLKQER